MTLVISCFFLLVSLNTYACHLASRYQDYISLSAPVTYYLKDLSLLKKLKAISSFHAIDKNDFQGDFLQGGVFISNQYWKNLKNAFVFFDQSTDLEKLFKENQLNSKEIFSRGLDPWEVYFKVKNDIQEYLIDCGQLNREVELNINKIKNELLQKSKLSSKKIYIFYLGEIFPLRKKPNLVMKDGFVLWFVRHQNLQTYPSELNYLSWSMKVVNQLKEKFDVIHIGLVTKNTKASKLEFKKISEQEYNLYHPALLVPGISSIRLMPELQAILQRL